MKYARTMLALSLTLGATCCSSEEAQNGADQADDDADDDNDDDSADDTDEDDADNDDDSTVEVNTNAPELEELEEEEVLIDEDSTSGSTDGSGFSMLGDACEWISEEPEQLKSPVDIIFVIDNSSSMAGEIEQVQERINEDFARIIGESGVDYRVIMIARYGEVNTSVGESDHPICIRAPLGAHDCSDPESQTLANNAPRFFHYSADVRSREPWCDILDGWDSPDELKLDEDNARSWDPIAPIGWRQFLREEAFKHFVVISDDVSRCSRGEYSFNDQSSIVAGENSAIEFDTALLALAPRQFGSNAKRNYKWHSIVGMPENANPLQPWQPSAPIQSGECNPGSEGPGTGFQALSVLTGGLRYPSCNNENFNAIFEALADGVVRGSLACEWHIPEVEDFNPEEVNMRWVPSSGDTQVIVNVESLADCEDRNGWYYDDNEAPTTVLACPTTCELLQTDPNGRVDLVFGCETVTATPRVR